MMNIYTKKQKFSVIFVNFLEKNSYTQKWIQSPIFFVSFSEQIKSFTF